MKVIAICDFKGGVGKTASSCAIAQGLAVKKKNKVLLIDADAQRTATTSIYNVQEAHHTLYDVIVGNVAIDRAIVHTPCGDIIPSDSRIANLDIVCNDQGEKKKYSLLRKALKSLDGIYSHIIIDTAPGVATLSTLQSLTASDGVLIPIMCSPDNFDNLNLTMNTVNAIKDDHNPDLRVLGVFFTMHTGKSNILKQYEEFYGDTCKALGLPLLKTTVRRSVVIQEAHALNENLFEYSPRSLVTKDYTALIKELKL